MPPGEPNAETNYVTSGPQKLSPFLGSSSPQGASTSCLDAPKAPEALGLLSRLGHRREHLPSEVVVELVPEPEDCSPQDQASLLTPGVRSVQFSKMLRGSLQRNLGEWV